MKLPVTNALSSAGSVARQLKTASATLPSRMTSLSVLQGSLSTRRAKGMLHV